MTAAIMVSVISFLWVLSYNWFVYILSISTFTIFLILFAVFFNITSKNVKSHLQIFIAPFIYSILMIVFLLGPLKNYWADWSVFHSTLAPLIWFVGSNGITFLIILMNSILAFIIIKYDKKVAITGLVLFFIILGNHLYSQTAIPEGQPVRVALLQGNFDLGWSWRHENAKGIILDTYENMSYKAAKENPEIIIWPEYALADDITKDDKVMERLSSIAQQTNSYLVLGTLRFFDTYYKNERNLNDIAIVFGPDGSLIGEFVSVKPLSFDPWVIPGNESKVLSTSVGNVGILMCFEETQGVAKDFSRAGAQFIIDLANNQRLSYTSGMLLSSRFSDLRAAETRKYFIRVTNTGITKIINPYGKIESQLQPYTRDYLIGNVYLNDNLTFYSKYGNLILYLVLFLLGSMFLKDIFRH